MVWNLKADKYTTDQYAIVDINISAKNCHKEEVITYIWHEIYLVKELKIHILIGTDIISLE